MKVKAKVRVQYFPHNGDLLIDVPDDWDERRIKCFVASRILRVDYEAISINTEE
jgi:hypothetical protein